MSEYSTAASFTLPGIQQDRSSGGPLLFHTWTFVLVFLPATLVTFHLLGRTGHAYLALVWITVASLFFCAWASPWSLLVYLLSLLVNYGVGRRLLSLRHTTGWKSRLWLIVGIISNVLALLGLRLLPASFASDGDPMLSLAVPVGLSFLTFQQIAYLVDTYRGELEEVPWLDYTLFLTFFPKLSAGPILRAREFIPQLTRADWAWVPAGVLVQGVSIFTLGLFKKMVLADGLVRFVDPVFQEAAHRTLPFWRAWEGTLAYTFLLYFDFSGYTDMAIGVAMMFGIVLPVNFHFPYDAVSIREFWRRWHMTFSRFLRDYVYIPLGGNRRSLGRTVVNVMVTMALAGLWHGLTATFLVWGVLHGVYLSINHIWRRLGFRLSNGLGRVMTFLAVAWAWVWFRADNVDAAWRITTALVDLRGLLPGHFGGAEWLRSLSPMIEYRFFSYVFRIPSLTVSTGSQELRLMDVLLSEPMQAIAWLAVSSFVAFRWKLIGEPTSLKASDFEQALTARRALLLGILLFLVLMASTSGEQRQFVYLQF